MKIISIFLILFSFTAQADFPLDRPYSSLTALQDKSFAKLPWHKSDVLSVLNEQTPVRSQGSRGTCSIFATTAYVESLLIHAGADSKTLDLSEEWLTYVVDRNKENYGSPVSENLKVLSEAGMINESLWPYDARHWTVELPAAKASCGHLMKGASAEEKSWLAQCLLVHRDPRLYDSTATELRSGRGPLSDQRFADFKDAAQHFQEHSWPTINGLWQLARNSLEVKTQLYQGHPVLLSLPFFYGAWNHRGMEVIGIGTADQEAVKRGEVGYPHRDSKDFSLSLQEKNLNAHSILLVGYDDEKEITTVQVMNDGSKKKITYRGVYYFKNSWGSDYFGKNLVIEGRPSPGYGMIVQDHGHHFGMFVYLR